MKGHCIRFGREYRKALESRVPAECVQRRAPGLDVRVPEGTFSMGGTHDVIGFT